MRLRRRILLLSLCILLGSAVQMSAAMSYTVTDLGDLQPTAVIDGPRIFGNLHGEPVVWQHGQVFGLQHDGHRGRVNRANARGDSVGSVLRPDGSGILRRLPAFWNPDGSLAGLPITGEGEAWGLNMARTIVGANYTDGQALRWFPEGNEEYLGHGIGFAVDVRNRVWGMHSIVLQSWDADGTPTNLTIVQAGVGEANDTTVAGKVADGPWEAAAHFRFPDNVTKLPHLDGRRVCAAWGINRHHVTVGYCFLYDPFRATIWRDANTVQDLNTLANAPFMLEKAFSISDDGHIVGTSAGRGWLLTPGHAPPSLAMHLNQETFAVGARLQTYLRITNPGPQLTTDMYVGIVFPDGQSVLWITDHWTLGGVVTSVHASPRDYAPLWRNVTWTQGLQTTWKDFLTHTFTGLEWPGTYQLVVGWTRPDSLADGRIDDGDILAIDWKTLSFEPRVASR